ncbi:MULTISPECIES: 5'-nucleotidase, lipoprotein e(P4) family [unclassified Mucilaginibacter]|uniref:5'-nucleotidase, lipoprotein e(P4) family n=1 Tax=unclassified Mucilaginibacter TaxID=2617802 RepID=UPI002AC8B6F7|nr:MULTISPECIES: 5'-nucleotidase, lipoprotein e(P4) family [unclassified Mucilaginibacter]MEB0262457.1 5'-nucleotidase, lipoprotein e(P4) family [Mucilaginibacter sp. 10I4]MEB0279282.1 5'-nucleotidase, lipoprotein e(P4) family [Mucilaginibacter sp. 10B2]MEB0302580.1 5'-nucleotidase, lipoprotein e(P4) family [Mucilaginibacter sp. 5C4]WPX23206.1 5'-nucleotidase, lipoprotein e(P4) family [Mucilaginibacter sp. 5C4]
MKRSLTALMAGTILLAACSTPKKTESTAYIANNGKVWASVWQQRAAEYKALCFQAYNTAKWRLDEALKNPGSKPLAVVTDIDETVLDNSPYDAMRAANNQEYSLATWKVWTAKAEADTVPGAPAFFKYAASKGVAVFYITNRDEDERAGTIKNLQRYNMPNTDNEHALLRQTASSKETRRQQVLKNYNIVLLCGDNLPDFDALYDNKPDEMNRSAATGQLKKEFGNKYIVIPNPSYGDFEGSLFNYNYKLSGAQKDSIIRAKVKVDRQ